jgi:cytochrome P450
MLLKSDPYKSIPGDKFLIPYVGNFLELLEYKQYGKLHQFFEAKFQKHGKFFKIKVMGVTALMVADSDGIKQILTSPSFSRSDTFQKALIDIMKYSLFAMPTNDMWRKYIFE